MKLFDCFSHQYSILFINSLIFSSFFIRFTCYGFIKSIAIFMDFLQFYCLIKNFSHLPISLKTENIAISSHKEGISRSKKCRILISAGNLMARIWKSINHFLRCYIFWTFQQWVHLLIENTGTSLFFPFQRRHIVCIR